MDAKLTLKLEKEVIDKAKRYARQQNQSLSRLIENLLRAIVTGEKKDADDEITPRVNRLSGVLRAIPDLDEKEAITGYLLRKHE